MLRLQTRYKAGFEIGFKKIKIIKKNKFILTFESNQSWEAHLSVLASQIREAVSIHLKISSKGKANSWFYMSVKPHTHVHMFRYT